MCDIYLAVRGIHWDQVVQFFLALRAVQVDHPDPSDRWSPRQHFPFDQGVLDFQGDLKIELQQLAEIDILNI